MVMTDMITTINNMPMNDIECYLRYTRHNWVYNTTSLLDAQKIKWSLIHTNEFDHTIANKLIDQTNIVIEQDLSSDEVNSGIYIKKPQGNQCITDVVIQKGDIKWMKTHKNGEFIENKGDVDLRIHAFVVLYFKKFNGCISVETIGNEIYVCHLHPTVNMIGLFPENVKLLIKKIFNKK
jgi:hypothetical protein